MKRLSLLLVVLGVFALVVSGCAGEKEEAGGDEEETATKPAEGDEAEAAADEGEEAEEAAEGEETEEAEGDEAAEGGEVAEIGVPECDEYVQKYMACVEEHVPEEASAQMMDAFKQSQEAWAEAAQNDEAKETLAETCTQALEQAKQAMSAYDCEW